MADTKLLDLTSASSAATTDVLYLSTAGGADRKITLQTLFANVPSNVDITGALTASGKISNTSGGGEFTNGDLTINGATSGDYIIDTTGNREVKLGLERDSSSITGPYHAALHLSAYTSSDNRGRFTVSLKQNNAFNDGIVYDAMTIDNVVGAIINNKLTVSTGGIFSKGDVLITGANPSNLTGQYPSAVLSIKQESSAAGGADNFGIVLGIQDTGVTGNNSSRIGFAHYTDTEEPVVALFGSMTSGSNIINIGGGTTYGNNATEVAIHASANSTTVSADKIVSITNSGVAITGDCDATTYTVNGTAGTDFSGAVSSITVIKGPVTAAS